MPQKIPPLFELDRPLPRDVFAARGQELKRLQGNILKGHGRDAQVHLFLTFKPRRRDEAKQFLLEFATKVTSAAEQREQTRRFRRSHKSELFAAVCLSAKGYRYLGLPTAGFSAEFRKGMKHPHTRTRLADPPVSRWEPHFQKDLHVMMLLAHDNIQELIRQLALIRNQASGFADITSELGIKMCDDAGRTIEHFGYVDGRSQPVFFREDVKKDSLNGRLPKQWDPSAGPSLVLMKDPLGRSAADCGTYYVFRKLEQNVKGFWKQVADLADRLQLKGLSRCLAGALVVGRFQDGTPVALHNQFLGKPSNDFVYTHADPDGNRCPFAAHIRKMNPRGDTNGQSLEEQRSSRLVRRGMPYGDPTPPGDDLSALPEGGVGLLFQCCQADLARQFEFVQKNWANNNALARPGTGKDPVIGQSVNGFPKIKFPKQWDNAERTPFPFHSFVTMKGGEYFFIPSLTFLRNLK
jgi:Dyp-type peroxidase family